MKELTTIQCSLPTILFSAGTLIMFSHCISSFSESFVFSLHRRSSVIYFSPSTLTSSVKFSLQMFLSFYYVRVSLDFKAVLHIVILFLLCHPLNVMQVFPVNCSNLNHKGTYVVMNMVSNNSNTTN